MFVCAVQFFAEIHPVTDESAGRFLGEDEPAKSLLCCKSVLDLSGLTPNRHIGPPWKTTEIIRGSHMTPFAFLSWALAHIIPT